MRRIKMTGLLSLLWLSALSGLSGCLADASEPTSDDPSDQSEAASTTTSTLWGANGERWTATSRLFDYSYAGYHAGEAGLPSPRATANVRSFGAVGDGKHDDTTAFQDAIDKTPSGVIEVPAGHYRITRRIEIKKSNLVLRGAGTDQTFLEFPKSLAEVDGKDPAKITNPSPYAFGDFFITLQGYDGGKQVTTVTAGAKRGDNALQVASSSGLKVGQLVTLVETDKNNTLAERLYADHADAGTDLKGDKLVHFHSRIKAIHGTTLTLERPLPIDVETRWQPAIQTFLPSVTESGIEHLTVHFRGADYRGHFLEAGFNAIGVKGVADSWVSDVRIVNADLGVEVTSSCFSTVDRVVLDTDYDRGARYHQSFVGHHALWVKDGSGDMLVTGFDVRKPFIHDLSTEGASIGTVFSGGKGVDINMDHHRNAPYATLFTNIDLGRGSRPFDSSGAGFRGAHSGAFSTFWNIRAPNKFNLPSGDFGPRLTFVGLNTSATAVPSSSFDWMLEKIAPTALSPADIQVAQRKKRIGR